MFYIRHISISSITWKVMGGNLISYLDLEHLEAQENVPEEKMMLMLWAFLLKSLPSSPRAEK